MIDIFQSIIAFIITLGVLITFHEFGHFWVARRCDVKILRFSVGFGRPLYTRHLGEDQTEFVLAALPLGGYVKMLDEREGEVNKEDSHRAFNNKSLSQRLAIVSAGPIFNFIFSVFAYWMIFVVGISGLKPIVGDIKPDSISARAGLQTGQEIVAVDNVKTPTWTVVIDQLVSHTVNSDKVKLQLENKAGSRFNTELDLSAVSIDEMAEGKLLDALGLGVIELTLPAVIGEILPGGAASESELKEYDEIIVVDGVKIDSWMQWVNIVRDNPGKILALTVLRGEETVSLTITPKPIRHETKTVGQIGAVAFSPEGLFDDYFTLETYSLPAALLKSVEKTWDMSVLILRVLGKMLLGEASVKNLSGPISIAQYAGQSAGIGLIAFISFMAIVSISLGVLNLLPVPLLDGGHLLYYLVEFAIGRPVSESAQMIGQRVGLVLLLGLMSIAFYNDIARLLM